MRGYHGVARNEALYVHFLADAETHGELEEAWYFRRAYLARYMRQPLSELDKLTVAESKRYMRAVGKIVDLEGPKPEAE